MKTLQQVEPRVPISSAPFTISQPGSYYLTTNLTVSGGDAITIAADGVTLDLNGFAIASTANPASGTAVLINGGLRDITIQNGHIQGGVTNDGSGLGFGYGIYYSGSDPQNVRVSGVSVSGCEYHGIYVGFGPSTTVENCVVRRVGVYGIIASTIRGCVAWDCGGYAIYGNHVSDSRGQSAYDTGLRATTAQNCYGQSGSGTGLTAKTAQNCYGQSGIITGLSADTAQNCYGRSSFGAGLSATTALNCYGDSWDWYGLYATTAQNCYGYNGSYWYGLYATTAQNCYGFSRGYYGLYATSIAIGCYGESITGPSGLYAQNAAFCVGSCPSGTAIEATIANGCWAAAGTNAITYKYNMP
jgi:hypothetical protein